MDAAFGIEDYLFITFHPVIRQRSQGNIFCAGNMILIKFSLCAQIKQTIIGFPFNDPVRQIGWIHMVHFTLHNAGEVCCIQSDARSLVGTACKCSNQAKQANQ